jgi:ribose/xylose/arabinose/galactoside ABC-type transport system permease subunit
MKDQLGSSQGTNDERLALVVDTWKYVVSVQMHFNDMGMSIRKLYFTILAAALGLLGVVQGKHIEISSPSITIDLVLVVILGVIPVSQLFYFLDRHWYHRLLQGAVAHCAEIESRYVDQLPEIQLGKRISAASPVVFHGEFWKYLFFFVRDERFQKGGKLHSDQKIEVLYKSVIFGALAIAAAYGLVNGVEFGHRSIPAIIYSWL